MTCPSPSPVPKVGANGQPVALLEIDGRVVEVDAEIAPIVSALNAAGVSTRASCCGHGFRPGNIALKDGRQIIIARDYAEARKIEALFPIDINGNARPSPGTDHEDAKWLRSIRQRPDWLNHRHAPDCDRFEQIADRLAASDRDVLVRAMERGRKAVQRAMIALAHRRPTGADCRVAYGELQQARAALIPLAAVTPD